GRAKTMQPYADDNRFNCGCASHLLAKLRLTRNTIHGQAAGMPQAWERRQATMKMLAADYCGTGEPNTVGGQKLVWKGDLMRYYRAPVVIEARWDETGATCLTEPRMLHPTSDLGKKTFPRPWDAIKASCKGHKSLPKCVPEDPASFDGKLRVSGIPEL
ncbi:MAG TPA: ADYC domain-containing protein, partial [Kofleriaceae bacterium]|nr:ADYC domain-containing protein [Kofleriaceae bacterium]